MPEAHPTYRKLPGRGGSMVTYHRLYEARDHLLQICSTGYSESYKRFYYRDIQACVVQRNRMFALYNWIYGSLFGLALAAWLVWLGISRAATADWAIFGMAVVLPLLVPLAANLAMGPTCACFLKTAVQFEKLGSLRRMRAARKTVARLKVLVEAAQGPISIEELQATVSIFPAPEAPPVAMAAPPANAAPMPEPPADPLKHNEGKIHLVLCWLLLADLPSTLLDYFKTPGAEALAAVLMTATAITALLAGVKQARTDLPGKLKVLPWTVLALMGVVIFISVVWAIVRLIKNRGPEFEVSVWTDPFLTTMTVATTAAVTVLGLMGLLWLRQWRAGPPPPPSPAPAGDPPPAQP